ncbi:FAM188A family protein [Megaselia abdita]
MSSDKTSACTVDSDVSELREIKKLLWSENLKPDVFFRWSQGFEFSPVEPSALVQKQGGPCAVIAPVQAYLLKILLDSEDGSTLDFNELPADRCRQLLIDALCCILAKAKSGDHFRIAVLNIEPSNTETATGSVEGTQFQPDDFHERLSMKNLQEQEDVRKFYTDNFSVLSGSYGVLLFMYSVLMTKAIEMINTELSDTSEPLIHSTYGYGSQALINLMLTGRAVSYVWDNDQDVGGLKLRGINQQAEIGFITLMEQMRYCTVGSFYKNPKNPVWVMGSETHLTVLFSHEKKLVSPETKSEIARRIFKSYDPDGNNFIPCSVFADVLKDLELVSEPEYVDIMQKKLDPENLGIILMNAFMDEFFADQTNSVPDTFDLMHYNGIAGSNEGNKVQYCKGSAILLESDLKSMCISNPMYTCLQTKWPNIEINWHTRLPSLN